QRKLGKELSRVEQVTSQGAAEKVAVTYFASKHPQKDIRLQTDLPSVSVTIVEELVLFVEALRKEGGSAGLGRTLPFAAVPTQCFLDEAQIVPLARDI